MVTSSPTEMPELLMRMRCQHVSIALYQPSERPAAFVLVPEFAPTLPDTLNLEWSKSLRGGKA